MSKGAMELESWVTWKTQKASDPNFERFDMRNEFEYGVTDRLQLAFYFFDWQYEESSTNSGEASFHDIAFEAIYNLTDPNTCARENFGFEPRKNPAAAQKFERRMSTQVLVHPSHLCRIGAELFLCRRREEEELRSWHLF